MAEKTPVSMLQELCIKQKEGAPFYEPIEDGTDEAKTFTYQVEAFGQKAKGSGRSKREAKHKASGNLISDLKLQERFRADLKEVPQTPRSSCENDAVSTLLDICVQRNWPIPTFKVQQACGAPHAPEFTVVCQLASIQRQGTFSTKKGAKQSAAQAMLDVVQSFQMDDDDKQITVFEPEPKEKIIRTYRDLKNSDIKPVVIRFHQRHNYFLRFPSEQRQQVHTILNGVQTAREMVHLICKALKVQYIIDDVPKHPDNLKMFAMKGDYDCVMVGSESTLCDSLVDYFRTMLNLKQFC